MSEEYSAIDVMQLALKHMSAPKVGVYLESITNDIMKKLHIPQSEESIVMQLVATSIVTETMNIIEQEGLTHG